MPGDAYLNRYFILCDIDSSTTSCPLIPKLKAMFYTIVMWGRRLFIIFSFLFLIAAIPFGVYLVKQQQSLGAQASTPKVTQLEIVSPTGDSFRITSPQVRVKVSYVPSDSKKPIFPSSFKISTSLAGLNNATEIPFNGIGQEVQVHLDNNPGPKTVYGQFKVNGIWSTVYTVTTVLDLPQSLKANPSATAVVLGANTTKYDLNHDGLVNEADAKLIQDEIRSHKDSTAADLNGDKVVNLQDYAELLKHLK